MNKRPPDCKHTYTNVYEQIYDHDTSELELSNKRARKVYNMIEMLKVRYWIEVSLFKNNNQQKISGNEKRILFVSKLIVVYEGQTTQGPRQ